MHSDWPALQVAALQAASAGSQTCPVAQVTELFVLLVQEYRPSYQVLVEVDLVQTQAESGAHWTQFPVPVQTGVAVGHVLVTQFPVVVLHALRVPLEEHVASELALHWAQAPLRQAGLVGSRLLQGLSAGAPLTHVRNVSPSERHVG